MFIITVYCADNRPVAPVQLPKTYDTLDDAKTHVDRLCAFTEGESERETFAAWVERFGTWYRECAYVGYAVEDVNVDAVNER